MLRRSLPGWVLAVGVLGAMAGCGPDPSVDTRLTGGNFDKIHPGMTTGEVRALLGDATEIGPLTKSRHATWSWVEGERRIEVLFNQAGQVESSGANAVKYGVSLE